MNPNHLPPRHATLAVLLVCALTFAACGDAPKPAGPAAQAPEVPSSYLLASSPGEPMPILSALEKSDGDEVILTGRVSSLEKGFAAFTLTDDAVPYCGKGEEECGCPTPWDYCCELDAAKAGRMPIEMRDAKGEPVAAASTGLRLLDLVVVKGTLAKTESGGMMLVVKDGWYREERPKLPEGLQWPE